MVFSLRGGLEWSAYESHRGDSYIKQLYSKCNTNIYSQDTDKTIHNMTSYNKIVTGMTVNCKSWQSADWKYTYTNEM